MKKKILGITLGVVLTLVGAVPAMAETVYYNGDAVSWDHGRKLAVYSYSAVQTSIYEHSATANTTSSGWIEAGTKAYAQQFVGTKTATAYWNCR